MPDQVEVAAIGVKVEARGERERLVTHGGI
jgi:hypothetical protein